MNNVKTAVEETRQVWAKQLQLLKEADAAKDKPETLTGTTGMTP